MPKHAASLPGKTKNFRDSLVEQYETYQRMKVQYEAGQRTADAVRRLQELVSEICTSYTSRSKRSCFGAISLILSAWLSIVKKRMGLGYPHPPE